MKISELKPYPKNAKLHDTKQIKLIAGSIKRFGFDSPIIIDKNNEIIAGHGRLEAAKLLNLKEVPIIRKESLTEEEVKAYRLADNKIAESGWDMKLTVEELKGLSDEMFELTGFDKDLLISPDEKDDIIPDSAPKRAIQGEIWALGRHRLMCGDSTKKDDVEKLMDGKQCDMIFIDPPYAVNYGADQDTLNKKSGNKSRLVARPIAGDNLSAQECAEKIWRPAFKNLYEIAKDDCSYYMTMCQGGDQMMMMMMMSENWQIKHELIWVKSSPVFSMGRLDYDYQHEPILFGWKKKHNWYGKGQFKKSVWEISKPSKSPLHPTTKPTELIVNALLNSSKAYDLIVDIFLGSGSTLIACEKTNRICYGMEIDLHYCDVIIKRYEDYTNNKAIKCQK